MATARLLVALLAALILTTSANAAPAATKAGPQSLRAFLFRADEPLKHEYSRTPAFAWAPVRGAQRYEFELATSSTFTEASVLFTYSKLAIPAVAIAHQLPWMTGQPYALWAHVRWTSADGKKVTPWSPKNVETLDFLVKLVQPPCDWTSFTRKSSVSTFFGASNVTFFPSGERYWPPPLASAHW